jgi:NTP pyrophosphatase (non-canonical NTP hydrolase)
MEPIHKFNNGRGAMLCNGCRTIISTGPKTEELFCDKCKQMEHIIDMMRSDEELGLYETEHLLSTEANKKRLLTDINKNMRSYNELEALVIAWAHQKGILDNGTPRAQAMKTWEETDELITAIDSNNKAEIEDALGDILVTIIIQAEMQQMSLIDCLESAYNVIAKRTGKMVNGQFVKDNTGHPGFDPNNASHT